MIRLLSAASVLVLLASSASAQPVRVLFDTDMGNDIDDALALAMLHALDARAEVDLLGVTITKDNRWSAPYVDCINTFYGRGDLPVGVVRDGPTPEDNDMTRLPVSAEYPSGQRVCRNDLIDYMKAPEAVMVLRRVLSAQPDTSVVMVQVGFSTNLARLLDSEPDVYSSLSGADLVRRKVRLLSIMAGAFPDGKPEYNVRVDTASAGKLFRDWPTPVVFSGFEVGLSILYPASSIEGHFSYAPRHPVVEGYRAYMEMPYDRPTWDLTSVLYAVRPDEGYFTLGPPGTTSVAPDGRTRFTPHAAGRHRYLIVDDLQRARVLEAMTALASQPPTTQR